MNKKLSNPGRPIWLVWSKLGPWSKGHRHVFQVTYLEAFKVLHAVRDTGVYSCGVRTQRGA